MRLLVVGAVAGCVCIVTTTLDEQGRVVQLADHQSLAYGEMDGSRSARMAQIDAFLRCGRFDAHLSRRTSR